MRKCIYYLCARRTYLYHSNKNSRIPNQKIKTFISPHPMSVAKISSMMNPIRSGGKIHIKKLLLPISLLCYPIVSLNNSVACLCSSHNSSCELQHPCSVQIQGRSSNNPTRSATNFATALAPIAEISIQLRAVCSIVLV